MRRTEEKRDGVRMRPGDFIDYEERDANYIANALCAKSNGAILLK